MIAGSPPRVRGKGVVHILVPEPLGITPAYAGKRRNCPRILRSTRDHPRVCGEKHPVPVSAIWSAGSPPRVRGKASCILVSSSTVGITPAYAGKSEILRCVSGLYQDHPRVCGEKSLVECAGAVAYGSPPRMRGKGTNPSFAVGLFGITPAYAGKSPTSVVLLLPVRDHPRVCGEKSPSALACFAGSGSPPRMRGKEVVHKRIWVAVRITPAYAGKRLPPFGPYGCRGDHPRVCGEKVVKNLQA